jgi:hypothetical protein
MDHFYDLAFALANQSLCLFTGAGFSKQLTANKTPSWKELLEETCSYLDKPKVAQEQLSECIAGKLPLEDCAQVIEIAFLKEKKDFREAIADKIRSYNLDIDSAKQIVSFLQNHQKIKVISTNYDDLIQKYILPDRSNTNYPGKPITQRNGVLEIYQIHGSVEHSPSIVATTEDYYRFINTPTYFSRKIFTLMAENTVVFLGYSLGDPNLKAIIHEFRNSTSGSLDRGDLYYITKSKVPQYLKDHFEMAFGLLVIDKMEIGAALEGIEKSYSDAENQVKHAERNLKSVLANTHSYHDKYLRSSKSLMHIMSVANETGQNLISAPFVKMLSKVLAKKMDFTKEDGAWEQYGQLAEWLVYIGSLVKISDTALEKPYLEAVCHSMKKMSGSFVRAASWQAFTVWQSNWGNIMLSNRQTIAEHVRTKLSAYSDALKIISDI